MKRIARILNRHNAFHHVRLGFLKKELERDCVLELADFMYDQQIKDNYERHQVSKEEQKRIDKEIARLKI